MLTLSAVDVSANSTKMEPLKSLLLRCRRNLTLFTWRQVRWLLVLALDCMYIALQGRSFMNNTANEADTAEFVNKNHT